jgi:hypothetical protein
MRAELTRRPAHDAKRRARSAAPGTRARGSAAGVPLFLRGANQRAHIQCKLTVGPVSDAFEREADAVAQRVSAGPALQRCSCGSGRADQGECPECRRARLRLQRSAYDAVVAEAPPIVQAVIDSPGQPLDAATRSFMEHHLGHDFTGVRVHTGARAAASAQAVQAYAYTVGPHIVFDAGQYAPATPAGRRLLAHELTHVVQQSAAPPTPSRAEGAAARAAPRGRVARYLARATCPDTKDIRKCPVGRKCGPGSTGVCRWYGITNGCKCHVSGPEPGPSGVAVAQGAIAGALIGTVLGGIIGGVAGAAGGTAVAPGVGTVAVGAGGAVAGMETGALIGAAAGGLVGGAIGWLMGD